MMSIKSVNALAHYTDWIIGHVHSGALGWNGFIAFGMIYYLIPRLWKVEVYSQRLVSLHFWLGTLGIVLYMTSMWASGVTQGLMWRAFNDYGTLKYPEFIETVTRLIPFYWIRLSGGVLYLTGTLLLAYNLLRTIGLAKRRGVDLSDTLVSVPTLAADEAKPKDSARGWHYALEGKALQFSLLTLVAVLIGGVVEIVPMLAIQGNVPSIPSVHPYTPLELEGRDIYIREGCYTCHSQMVRPFREEVVRYGEYSKAGEFVYDRPFQFGSKRTGPDLHRLGGKYPDYWHYRHMLDPRSTTPGSIMPAYPWLYESDLDTSLTQRKVTVLKRLGAPYTEDDVANASALARAQADGVVAGLVEQGVKSDPELPKKEIIALIAYLQRLGKDIKKAIK